MIKTYIEAGGLPVYLLCTSQGVYFAMATKLERTVIVPETVYAKIRRLAESEQTNIPFVTRQLLVMALAKESRPDWSYDIQREITGLRNDLLIAQRKKEQQERSGEQLLMELQKQIAELKDALVVLPGKAKVEMEDEKGHEVLLWSEIEAEPVKEAELVQVIASNMEPEKGKVLRPFFGRLGQMFGAVLN